MNFLGAHLNDNGFWEERLPTSDYSLIALSPTPHMRRASVPILAHEIHFDAASAPCGIGIGLVDSDRTAHMTLPIFVAREAMPHWTDYRPWNTNEWYASLEQSEEFDITLADFSEQHTSRVLHHTVTITPGSLYAARSAYPKRTVIQTSMHTDVPAPVTGNYRMPNEGYSSSVQISMITEEVVAVPEVRRCENPTGGDTANYLLNAVQITLRTPEYLHDNDVIPPLDRSCDSLPPMLSSSFPIFSDLPFFL